MREIAVATRFRAERLRALDSVRLVAGLCRLKIDYPTVSLHEPLEKVHTAKRICYEVAIRALDNRIRRRIQVEPRDLGEPCQVPYTQGAIATP